MSTDHPHSRNASLFVLQATAASGLAGATFGSLLASARGQSRLAWGFSMGANWTVVALPFFGIREGVLYYRHWQNDQRGQDSYRLRNKDEIIASIASGAVVGAGIGLMWRGPKAMIAGSLMYALIACGTQSAYLFARQYRLRRGLEQRLQSTQLPTPPPWSLRQFLEQDILRSESHAGTKSLADSDFDPLGAVFMWARNKINENVDVPDWTSPLLNAWDFEYRKRLSLRLGILEVQVADLRETVGRLRREVGVREGLPGSSASRSGTVKS
ncbi:hypothetical protein BDZ88DRAFT_108786 [Geranomyces variabilis]|nr:hypothetical protein BDZ88DRAFT_108786 [Geranomyces variabilis]KAJ3141873.1 hypothetical protein HDU90_006222 [Geranomyces variabilis]